MKEHFLNILMEFRNIAEHIKDKFLQGTQVERLSYGMKAYSVYVVLLTFIFSRMHGILAAYVMLFYSAISFVAVSFMISKNMAKSAPDPKKEEQKAFVNAALFAGIVFVPTAVVFAGIVNVAVSFFAFVFFLAFMYSFSVGERSSQLKMLFHAITKTKKERKEGGLSYAVREVPDPAKGIQE